MTSAASKTPAVTTAAKLLDAYLDAIARLRLGLDASFENAVQMMLDTKGHVVVCGMGKSGLIGRKIAATLASTGTPSLFLHPAEAIHGDLGMVRPDDVVLLLSNSGETEEILRLLPALKRLDTRLIALTSGTASTLANEVALALDISVDREACPLNLAPTTSSLNTLVVGDALAVALMEKRGFEEVDFARMHPGGSLGARLLTHVRDKMRSDNLPFVAPSQTVQEALMTMTEGRLGMVLVGSRADLHGIVTDGDLRRLLVDATDLATTTVGEVASKSPLTISGNLLMADAEAKMLEARVQCLVVTDDDGHVDGVIQIFE
tara:strand:- start:909 stop:1865 length:957 start_codon:yes stop_codon:yes gene_type:complete